MLRPTLGLLVSGVLACHLRADVIINEVMYHPQSGNSAEEYIELYNSEAAELDLSAWKITSGVQFTFPAGTKIPAGGYLVVAADASAFSQKYPTVAGFVAG